MTGPRTRRRRLQDEAHPVEREVMPAVHQGRTYSYPRPPSAAACAYPVFRSTSTTPPPAIAGSVAEVRCERNTSGGLCFMGGADGDMPRAQALSMWDALWRRQDGYQRTVHPSSAMLAKSEEILLCDPEGSAINSVRVAMSPAIGAGPPDTPRLLMRLALESPHVLLRDLLHVGQRGGDGREGLLAYECA